MDTTAKAPVVSSAGKRGARWDTGADRANGPRRTEAMKGKVRPGARPGRKVSRPREDCENGARKLITPRLHAFEASRASGKNRWAANQSQPPKRGRELSDAIWQEWCRRSHRARPDRSICRPMREPRRSIRRRSGRRHTWRGHVRKGLDFPYLDHFRLWKISQVRMCSISAIAKIEHIKSRLFIESLRHSSWSQFEIG